MNETPTVNDYRPFDQYRWLGDPPWSGDELIAWEIAHGHDVRMKCYVEYGCQAVVPEAFDEGRAEIVKLIEQAIADDVLESTMHGEPCVRVDVLRAHLHGEANHD